ncbi:MAG: hypothetical protein DI560_20335 [Pseudomonas putida]|nr:MAG: hypothetical protein DI560_20335 [Pseudomonas putida]
MKFLDDIMQSISGSTKTKVEDPFIGAFIGSWIICNWTDLALLVWGDGTPAERINALGKHFNEMDVVGFNSILVMPLIMTVFFLFAFPWVSFWLKSVQKFANERLHQQAVSIEINKVKQQEALNKQRLLANPEKEFLAESLKLDIERRKELIEQLRLRTTRFKDKSEAAAAIAAETKAAAEAAAAAAAEARGRASLVELEEVKRKGNAELEKQRFILASAQLKAAQASSRFPSVYGLMQTVEESLKNDEIYLSLDGLGAIVAMIFGYKSFYTLLHDDGFNNKNLAQVSYIYYDREDFASALEAIVQNESARNEGLEAEALFDHVISIFESSEFKLLSKDEVEDVCREICEDMKDGLMDGEEFSGPIADSDTIYDDIEIDELKDIKFEDGLAVTFSGSATGSHRKEYDVPGRDIKFSIELKSAVVVGLRGLGEFKRSEVSASLADYDYDPDYEADET